MDEEVNSVKRCPNCGAPLAGKFCSNCGQEDANYNVSLKHLIPEILDEYLGVNSQLFKSVPLILFKPGFLTNAFIAGKREKYVSPVRLYIIVSILFFLAISLTRNKGSQSAILPGMEFNITNPADSAAAARNAHRINSPKGLSYNFTLPFFGSGSDSAHSRSDWSQYTARQSNKIMEHKDEIVSLLRDHYPEMMIFFLPISAILLKLLYVFQKRLYVEHLIFSLHLHSFVFIALAVGSALGYAFHSFTVALLVFFAIMAYIYAAFHKVYAQSVVKNGVKMLAFLGMYAAAFFAVNICYFMLAILLF